MHFLGSSDQAFARFMAVASNAHRLLERGDIDEFVVFHERVVKLVGMCRNRVRRAAYATSKNMLVCETIWRERSLLKCRQMHKVCHQLLPACVPAYFCKILRKS